MHEIEVASLLPFSPLEYSEKLSLGVEKKDSFSFSGIKQVLDTISQLLPFLSISSDKY